VSKLQDKKDEIVLERRKSDEAYLTKIQKANLTIAVADLLNIYSITHSEQVASVYVEVKEGVIVDVNVYYEYNPEFDEDEDEE